MQQHGHGSFEGPKTARTASSKCLRKRATREERTPTATTGGEELALQRRPPRLSWPPRSEFTRGARVSTSSTRRATDGTKKKLNTARRAEATPVAKTSTRRGERGAPRARGTRALGTSAVAGNRAGGGGWADAGRAPPHRAKRPWCETSPFRAPLEARAAPRREPPGTDRRRAGKSSAVDVRTPFTASSGLFSMRSDSDRSRFPTRGKGSVWWQAAVVHPHRAGENHATR